MRVVLPWSTCAITATFRRREGSREGFRLAAELAAAVAEEKKRGAKKGLDLAAEERECLRAVVLLEKSERRSGPVIIFLSR